MKSFSSKLFFMANTRRERCPNCCFLDVIKWRCSPKGLDVEYGNFSRSEVAYLQIGNLYEYGLSAITTRCAQTFSMSLHTPD